MTASTELQAPPPAPPPPDPGPPLASWTARVVATLLDQALVAGVTWLAFAGRAVEGPSMPVDLLSAPPPDDDLAWTDSGWVVATLAALLIMQAYLGSTPGKLVVGIAVVRDTDARPIGIVRTLARALAHVLDGLLLLIGYLRPLWHHERRTFADSLAGTLALRTRAPLPYPVGDRPPAPPEAWQEPAAPSWRRAATCVAAVACALGAVTAVLPRSTSSEPTADARCRLDVGPVDPGAFTLVGGTVTVHRPSTPPATSDVASEAPGVVVVWDWLGAVDEDTRIPVAVEFQGADGRSRSSSAHTLTGSGVRGGQGVPLDDGSWGVRLPLSVLDGIREPWQVTFSAEVGDGTQLCSTLSEVRP